MDHIDIKISGDGERERGGGGGGGGVAQSVEQATVVCESCSRRPPPTGGIGADTGLRQKS